MAGKRFLERVRTWNGNKTVYNSWDNKDNLDSVVEHLNKLLNSKQGTTLMDKEYGMPDFNDFASKFPGSMTKLETSLSDLIEKYEPRLSNVSVKFVLQNDLDLSLVFEINAGLRTNGNHERICIESLVNSSGKMRIRS